MLQGEGGKNLAGRPKTLLNSFDSGADANRTDRKQTNVDLAGSSSSNLAGEQMRLRNTGHNEMTTSTADLAGSNGSKLAGEKARSRSMGHNEMTTHTQLSQAHASTRHNEFQEQATRTDTTDKKSTSSVYTEKKIWSSEGGKETEGWLSPREMVEVLARVKPARFRLRVCARVCRDWRDAVRETLQRCLCVCVFVCVCVCVCV